ncbi:MAG: hypothetical protein BHW64_03075 [Candidatus Melainabacteria bacterium LEY3_CP_29_8]|nr:MAG: hypothetical protein BHW64_03075 [Candidatus Melainabacteria bacterium LEY3_CP_29_8]
MNLFNNKDIRNLFLIIFIYMAIAFIPLLLTICLILIYMIKVNGEYLYFGLGVVLFLPGIIAYIFKLVFLPIISFIIYERSSNSYIKYMFQTFKIPFLLLICVIIIDKSVCFSISRLLNPNEYIYVKYYVYMPLFSLLSSYLPFYIISFICALSYKFFNKKSENKIIR